MKSTIIFLVTTLCAISVFAQAPQSFNYQTVVRDGNGDLVVNQPVSLQMVIIQGTAPGTVVYTETHSVTTNGFGLVTLAVGTGTVDLGDFTTIDWSAGPYSLKVKADLTGGTNFVDMGDAQILSVPYALHSKTSEDAFSGNYNDLNGVPTNVSTFTNDAGYVTTSNDADADPANEIQTLTLTGTDLTISGGNTVTIPQTVYTAGTGIGISGNTINNTLPDQTISITGSGATTVTGTYPSFTISSTDNVNDADVDPTNELQSLSFINDTLFLTNGGFVPLSGQTDTLWRLSGNNMYSTNSGKVGVGTSTPPAKFVVQGDNSHDTIPLFEIKDRTGATVFIVYPDSVRIYVGDDGSKTNKGAFAVSGRNTAKQLTHDFLWVTPDSTRIFTGDSDAGFGVENIETTGSQRYMRMTPDNYFIGHEAGLFNTMGLYNSYIGYQAGYLGVGGNKNYFIGYKSGYNNSGSNNIFIGDSTGYSNTSGLFNLFIGNQAGYSNTSGNFNIAIGTKSLFSNTVGIGNQAAGMNSMYYNTTGNYNVAFGWHALHYNVSGSSNTAVGTNALLGNQTGDQNTGIGMGALLFNSTGYDNTAVGFGSMQSNTSGYNNIAMGSNAMDRNKQARDNMALGTRALFWNQNASNNIAVGNEALYTLSYLNGGNVWSTDNVAIGYKAMYATQPINATSGYRNTSVGNYSLTTNTTGSHNVVIGYEAMKTSQSGHRCVAVGAFALFSTSTSSNNTAVGYQAMYSNSFGIENVAMGMDAMYSNTSGTGNSGFGYNALSMNQTGNYNTAVGSNALYQNTGTENTAMGYLALYQNTGGAQNTACGSYALMNNTQYNNSAFGYNALKANTSGFFNTAVGSGALTANTTGYFNTALGYNAFSTGTGYTNSTAIGYNTAITANNRIALGNTAVTWIGGQVTWSTYSDARFKKNVNEDVPGLSFITQLRPVTYNYDMDAMAHFFHTPDSLRLPDAERNQAGIKYTGFIAQEVDAIAKNLGYNFSGVCKPENADDFYSIRYAEFTVPLVKAVQELNEENARLAKENLQQQIVIDQLIQRIEKLEGGN
jgi:hypothetical protein